ncbi:protein MAIN-LIKE 2-like [Phaseolus vulgaris]|uniref:protein MAIN-LIKE 2-like n=1 Tax=Phaseolus vulgaris TaxID=3885 RepID=UPI0035CAAE0A
MLLSSFGEITNNYYDQDDMSSGYYPPPINRSQSHPYDKCRWVLHLLTTSSIDINYHLITVLIERWRTKTYTFHFPLGESTITLQDVALQLGVPIDGEPVTGFTSRDMVQACQYLLGSIPPSNVIKGNTIKLSWLNNNFQQLSANVMDDVIAQHARAHILSLIGSLLVPTHRQAD